MCWLTSLNADCLTILATYLNGADFCRFIASSRQVVLQIAAQRTGHWQVNAAPQPLTPNLC